MKFQLFTLYFMLMISACRPYKESEWSGVSSSDYSKINYMKNKMGTFCDFPKRICKSYLFKYKCFTNDNGAFKASKGNVSLFIEGAYNELRKCGYIIYSNYRNDTTNTYTCIIFKIEDNRIVSDYYNNIPNNAISWESIQPYLIPSMMGLFGGRTIMTRKELKELRSCQCK
jgi:hypothetical protein